MTAAVSHSKKTAALNEPACLLNITFQYYSEDLSNSTTWNIKESSTKMYTPI